MEFYASCSLAAIDDDGAGNQLHLLCSSLWPRAFPRSERQTVKKAATGDRLASLPAMGPGKEPQTEG